MIMIIVIFQQLPCRMTHWFKIFYTGQGWQRTHALKNQQILLQLHLMVEDSYREVEVYSVLHLIMLAFIC